MTRVMFAPLAVTVLTGCFEEGLLIEDLKGKVVIPKEATVLEVDDGEGGTRELSGVPLLGPVTLGLYADIDNTSGLPMPKIFSTGPQDAGVAYPYGGTTIGDFRNPCLEFFRCKLVSGRHVDFDSVVDWFNETLQDPILDAAGEQVDTGDYIRQVCYDLLEYTSDSEIRITVTEDRNGDEKLDEGDLDFVLNDAGDAYEAEFTIFQQDFYEGFKLWGWMDAPAVGTWDFDTCTENRGYQENTYNRNYQVGAPDIFLLNSPASYLRTGDWVPSQVYEWTDFESEAVLTIDTPFGDDAEESEEAAE